jgi:hypothetical protein
MRFARQHLPLTATAAAMSVLVLVSTAGLVLDDRVLVGVPIWLKPLKFAISLTIYSVTFAWLISMVRRWRRLAWWLGTVIAAASVIEMTIIVGQVIRGRQSHFNVSTPLDSALFSIMGATIAALWLATAAVAALLLRQPIGDPPMALAIRLGLPIALAGLSVGFLMLLPTPAQRATIAAGTAPTVVGAHSVGVPDGGPGLPLVNWSTTGGDLRIGHFVGMHALQALPLLAAALTLAARRVHRLRAERVRTRLVGVAAAGYAGLVVLVTWQALRGQSLIHPDASTLSAAAVVLGITAIGTAWALSPAVPARDSATTPDMTPDTAAVEVAGR